MLDSASARANVMLEAMAAGVPVVATAISGVSAALGGTLEEPPAGWIAPPENAAALSRALAEVLTDARAGGSETGRRTAEAARRVREWFGLERMLDQAESILFSPDAAG